MADSEENLNIDIVGVKGLKTIILYFTFFEKRKLYCLGNVRHFRNYLQVCGATGCGNTTENEIKINTSQVQPRKV